MTYKKLFTKENISIKEAIKLINKNGKKSLIIIDNKNCLLGVLSDGDIRKNILKGLKIESSIRNIYNKKPISIFKEDYTFKKVFSLFKKNLIDIIPIINKKNQVIKVYTLDDILKTNNRNKFIPKKISNCEIVILSGGIGTRLKPFTNILPKALIPLEGIAIIEHIIKSFNQYKIFNINIITNYKSKIIYSYIKENESLGKNNFKFYEEKKPLGTAGGLYLLRNKIKSDFILTNCDILIKHDIYKIFKYHKVNQSDLTLVVFKKTNVLPYGNCNIDSDNNLIDIEEKPKSNFTINAGLYVINNKIFDLIKKNHFININELIIKMINKNYKVKVYHIDEDEWFDIGEWPEYYKTVENITW